MFYVGPIKGRSGWQGLGASSSILSRTALLLPFLFGLVLCLILRSYVRFYLTKKKKSFAVLSKNIHNLKTTIRDFLVITGYYH